MFDSETFVDVLLSDPAKDFFPEAMLSKVLLPSELWRLCHGSISIWQFLDIHRFLCSWRTRQHLNARVEFRQLRSSENFDADGRGLILSVIENHRTLIREE